MDHTRRFDAWSRGWLIASTPVQPRRPPGDARLPAPTLALLLQMRYYLGGAVPG